MFATDAANRLTRPHIPGVNTGMPFLFQTVHPHYCRPTAGLLMQKADHIQRTLDRTKGKVEGKNGAAEMLGINPGTLRGRMKKFNIF